MNPREEVSPMWLESTGGARSEYDQVKAAAIDSARESRFAIVCTQDAEGEARIISACDGEVGDVTAFFLGSLVETFTLVQRATSLTPLELWAAICLGLGPSSGEEAS